MQYDFLQRLLAPFDDFVPFVPGNVSITYQSALLSYVITGPTDTAHDTVASTIRLRQIGPDQRSYRSASYSRGVSTSSFADLMTDHPSGNSADDCGYRLLDTVSIDHRNASSPADLIGCPDRHITIDRHTPCHLHSFIPADASSECGDRKDHCHPSNRFLFHFHC